MARILQFEQIVTGRELPLGDFVISHPSLAFLAAFGTVVFETGFVFVVLAGWPIWVFAIGLIGMHTGIAVAMTPFFWNHYVLFALFLPYDRLFSRLESDRPIDIVYDERCYFCARSLTVFNRLDMNDTVRFYSQSTVPDQYTERADVDFKEAMVAFVDGESHRGYDAFVALLAHYRITLPIVLLMRLPGIRHAGERVYAYVAANRQRYFVCSVE